MNPDGGSFFEPAEKTVTMKQSATHPAQTLGYSELKARQRKERGSHSEGVALRVHRAISWLGRAEQEHDDPDAQFIFLWIAFNAAYASGTDDPDMTERRAFLTFLRTLLRFDTRGRFTHLVWKEYSSSIRLLLANPYLSPDFWRYHSGKLSAADWNARFKASRRAAERALAADDTLKVLAVVLGRLYVLRNQLLHGGATWNSGVNRDQVRDCTRLLGKLAPMVIEIMMDHPEHNWGTASYPVVNPTVESKRRA